MRECTTFNKGIYWHDWVTSEDEKSDLKVQVLDPCDKAKISIKKMKCAELPQCLEENFDILFFDWGGMSLGNSLMEHFCRHIYKQAQDNPSRFYIMVSTFTKYAMKEAIEEFGEGKPFNIFLSIDDFESWLDKNYED